ncbi:MAG: ABC transporter ATP-binding protein/permease [Candidatus Cloacimonetes bacterium]|nr:ABC transporter ATP-binding protein/permease [Candidatus Cloacimonadota bacterium]
MKKNKSISPKTDQDENEKKDKFFHIKWIISEWRPYKYFTIVLLLLTILSSGVAVAYPILLKELIDNLKMVLVDSDVENPMNPVYKVSFMLLMLGIVRLIVALYPSFRAYMNLLFEFLLRKRYFKNILEKDYSFFLKFRTGDLVTRLTADINDFPKIGWFLCSGIFRAFDSLVKIIFCVSIMFFLSWKLTIFVLLPIPFMIIAFYIASDILHKRFKKNQEAISEINNQLEMTFSGIKIIKSFVCEDKYKRFFDKALKNRFDTEFNLVKIGTILHLIYEYIDFLALIAVILFGGYLTVVGSISIGTFVAFYAYLSMLVYPILDLPQLFISGKQAFVCIDRLEEIKNFPTKTYHSVEKNSKNYIETKTVLCDIESIRFENVTFNYEDTNANIFENLTFEIKKGEKVLILGRSGVGKTTMLGLLNGLLIPHEGTIFINNIPLYNIDLFSLRNLLGFVPQEPSLFTGTIKDNVLFGTSVADHSDIKKKDWSGQEYYERIISAIQMKDEISQFIEGDLTVLGVKGLSLSGGQKQRIAIARALHKKPQLLILDDITASLDAKKEELLWEQISLIFKDLTAFIVSHRLSSLRYANKIIFLEDQKLCAFGNHENLINENQKYKEFVQHHYK